MMFYEQLIRISPTLGTRTGYAAAVAEAKGPEAGLAVLDGIDPDDVSAYQPYWAVRAHLLQRLGKTSEAAGCLRPGDWSGRGPRSETVPAPKARLTFFIFPVEITAPYPSSYRGGLTVELATEEVHDVSILFGNHGIGRCRGGFYRRYCSVGCESFSQKERSRRNRHESQITEEK